MQTKSEKKYENTYFEGKHIHPNYISKYTYFVQYVVIPLTYPITMWQPLLDYLKVGGHNLLSKGHNDV